MENYSNSNKAKTEQQKQEKERAKKVITGKARIAKVSPLKKLVQCSGSDIKDQIINGIIIPTVKSGLTASLDMILYGEARSNKTKSSASRVSYTGYYSDKRDDESRRSRSSVYDDIIVDSRADAEAILDRMDELIDKYGVASVLDLYDFADIKADYTADAYGWTNIATAEVVRARDGGYIIRMPRVKPIR